ncbi:MAG: DNA polymerase III subunit gamma/tau [Cyanobacteriota bacterium]
MLQTYVPLYRKYRPQTFKDLVGQGSIAQTLSNAILNNKIAHAYLFTGPRGTGKTSSARILAKSLNCEKGPTPEPCGVCSSCHNVTDGTAIDVIEIDAASNSSVHDARELIEKVHYASVAGRYKIYIIDEVHMLSSAAFNALLKTLEEPPSKVIFVLATTELHKVLETIISRCQRFDFRRVSQKAIVERLKYISEVENIKISEDALNLIARRSSGGLRDAVGLLDQISVLSDLNQCISIKDVLSLIGALPEDMLVDLSEAIADNNGAEILKITNDIMSLGSEPIQIIKELTIHFRNLLIASTVKDDIRDIIDASEEFYDELRKIAAKFKQIEIAQIIDRLAYTERMVRNASQPTLWLEVGLLSICYRHDILILEDLQKRVEELECIVASGNVPPELTLSCEKRYVKPDIPRITAPKSVKTEQISRKEEQKTEKVVLKNSDELRETAKPLPLIDKKTLAVEPTIEPEKQEVKIENQKVETEVANESVVEEQESTFISTLETASESVDALWKAVLNSIDSPPTRGLLSSLAVPLAITPQEVVIAFSQDIFIVDIKNPKKLKSLEDSLKKVLGKSPVLTFKLLSDQEHAKKKQITLDVAVKTEKKIVDEPKVVIPVSKEQQVDLEKDETSIEIEAESFSGQQTQPFSPDLSEQAQHVKDIFEGKILNQ